MTAEIAILTKNGIAIAADSALTIGKGNRVWQNSNKLFSLSISNDIGIMIYGNADFCGVAWEVIIKEFRKKIGKKTFNTVDECSVEFKKFVDNFKVLSSMQDLKVYSDLDYILDNILADYEKSGLNKIHKIKMIKNIIDDLLTALSKNKIVIKSYDEKKFNAIYKEQLKNFIDEFTIKNNQLKAIFIKSMIDKLLKITYLRQVTEVATAQYTGVVIFGYGREEIFPVLQHYVYDGKCCGVANAWIVQDHNLNTTDNLTTLVLPFAQDDAAALFMGGVHPEVDNFINSTLKKILDAKTEQMLQDYVPKAEHVVERHKEAENNAIFVKEFMKEFSRFQRDKVSLPILNVIENLPKEEMAATAEALVELTSLRRKFDSAVQSVGGPVDVAIITKSDGFVWIKRKQYFNIDINNDFMTKRKMIINGEL